MEIYIERTNKTIQDDFTGSVQELLDKLHVLSDDVLVICNGSLVTEDEVLTNEDSIKLLSVISGG
jgi:sulfur carrier protein ThiS